MKHHSIVVSLFTGVIVFLILAICAIVRADSQGCILDPNCSIAIAVKDKNNQDLPEITIPISGEDSIFLTPSVTPTPNQTLPESCQFAHEGLVALIYVMKLLTINVGDDGVMTIPDDEQKHTFILKKPADFKFVWLLKPKNVAHHKFIIHLSVFANFELSACLFAQEDRVFDLNGIDDLDRDVKAVAEQKAQDERQGKILGYVPVIITILTGIAGGVWALYKYIHQSPNSEQKASKIAHNNAIPSVMKKSLPKANKPSQNTKVQSKKRKH